MEVRRFEIGRSGQSGWPALKTVTILRSDGSQLCIAEVADSLWTRGRGLLGRRSLAADQGLLITPCTSVHTWFMRFPIDVLYMDERDRVVKATSLKTYRMSFGGGRAKKVLELPH